MCSTICIQKERQIVWHQFDTKSRRKDQNTAVDWLDDLPTPEASFSYNFCFLLWKEKHCPELPWKSHREPKPKPNSWGKLLSPNTLQWIKETKEDKLPSRGRTKRWVSPRVFTNNQAFCMNRENVDLKCFFCCIASECWYIPK